MTARIRTNRKKGVMIGILFSVLMLQSLMSGEDVTKDHTRTNIELSDIVSAIKNAVKL